MKKMTLLSSLIAIMVLGSFAFAAPWESFLGITKVEADPEKDYRLEEKDGPWLILACTFSGEGAEKDAHELILELRQRYKLPAFSHHMTKNLDSKMLHRGMDRYGKPAQWKYQSGHKVDEIGVLIGHFSGVDDPGAQKVLEEIKFSTPHCLNPQKDKKSTIIMAGFREFNRQVLLAAGKGDKKKGPMSHAFIVPNPLIDQEDLKDSLDPFVVRLNEGVENSLLECPGKYTVKVAHFTGKVVLNQNEIHQIQLGQKKFKPNGLDQAAEKAERLTKILRKQGYDAYVFHDRYASFVTIGSFDAVSQPLPNGKKKINPGIREIVEKFKGKPTGPGGPIGSQVIDGIPMGNRTYSGQSSKRIVRNRL